MFDPRAFLLPVHMQVRMVEPPIAQRLSIFCAKLQLGHLRASGSKLNSLLPFNFYPLPEVLKSLILSHAKYNCYVLFSI